MDSILSEEQLQCSICLEIYENPVSIPCGHNFCLNCIKHYWETSKKCDCPLCKEVFPKRTKLKINVALKEIVRRYKGFEKKKAERKPRSKPQSTKQPSSPDVSCDLCHESGTAAITSCLVCKTSYCEKHLRPHLKEPELTKHRLTTPTNFTSPHLCKKHNQLLTMFCESDLTPMCTDCTDSNHKHHNIITINNKSKRVKTQIKQTTANFQQMIQARIRKIEEIKNSVELSKVNKERELETSSEAFSMVISAFERSRALFIAEIEQKHGAIERRAEEIFRELSQEIRDLQKRCKELQHLEYTDDCLHLIRSFPPLCAPVSTTDWSTVTLPTDMYMASVRRDFSKLVDICHELEKKLCADEVYKISQYAADITFEPVTAAGWLTLSPDNKKVSVSNQKRKSSLPNDPRRFDSCVSILGKQRFTYGKHYWVVQVKDKTDWDLGVAKESINRKGTITVRPDSGFWAICRRKGGSLIACAGPSVVLNLEETPQKVGIFLDYEEGLVAFYDADANTHIYTYSGCSFAEPLYPYFNPGLHFNGKNTAPLVICPLEIVF